MSSDIIYEQAAARIPASHLGAEEDLFLIVQQIANSRTYEAGTRRRSRGWTIMCVGTREQVITEAIVHGCHFESQMLRWKSANGNLLAEEFIAKVRRQLEAAQELTRDDCMACGAHTVQLRIQLPSGTTGGCGAPGEFERFSLESEQQMREFYARYRKHSEQLSLSGCISVYGPAH